MFMKKPMLTLIVPVFNEEEAIKPFLEAINYHLVDLAADLEILFIDDGSTDQTRAEMQRARESDKPL